MLGFGNGIAFLIYILPVREILQKIRSITTLQRTTIAVVVSAFAALYLSGWKPLKMQGIGGGHDYSDLTSVLNAAKCFNVIGSDVYTVTDSCGYQYGLFLLKMINVLQLNSLTPLVLGGLLFTLVSFLLLLIGVRSSVSRKHVVLTCLILLSPGPWLLFERGNFDLLIILFLAVTVLTLNTKFSFIGALLLLATALMKFYTFPLLFLYLILEKNKWHKALIAFASLAIIPLMVSNIVSAPGYPNPMYVAFGLPIPGLWVNFFAWRFNFDLVLGMLPQYIIGVFAFISVLLYFQKSSKASGFRSMFTNLNFSSNLEKNVFLFSSSTYVACFLAGSNFDYRLIFLAISLVLLNKALVNSMQSRFLISLEIAALWLTYFYFGAIGAIPVLLSITGNAAQLILAVVLSVYLFRFGLVEAQGLVKSRFGFRKVS